MNTGDRDLVVLGTGMHPWGKWGRNFVEYGVVAAQAALAEAGVEWNDIQFVSGGETVRNGYPGYVAGATFAQALGWNGAQVASSYAACASGVTALSAARAQILAGFCDVALVIGADTTPKGFFAPVGGGDRKNDPDWLRFHLLGAEMDVLKALYESLIDPVQRHDLGEYYTPDWLATKLVRRVVVRPLEQRILDPACGSGTFLFHGIRRLLAAARDAGWTASRALSACTAQVRGLDVHPVAVIIARVTWLLALGDTIRQRTQDLHVPVFLGDALQFGNPPLLPGVISGESLDPIERLRNLGGCESLRIQVLIPAGQKVTALA